MIALKLLIILVIGATGMFLGKYLWKKWQQNYDKRKMKQFLDGQNYDLIHIFTSKHKYDGKIQKFYTLRNALQMPAERAISAEALANQAEMNITRKELIRFFEKIDEAVNAGRMTEVLADIGKIRERLDWIAEEETLLNLSKVYFFLEGEDPACPLPKYDVIKDQIFKKEPEARSFFLQAAIRLTGKYGDISEGDILPYLAKKRLEKLAMTAQFMSSGSNLVET